METDAELVLAARRGSREALGAIFDRHWPRVWRAAYATCADHEIANDAAQDAFLRAASAFRRFDPHRPLEPWLVRIAVNRAIDLVRRERRLVPAEDAAELFRPDDPLADEELAEALCSLGPERRAVIVLHYWLDYTTPEIAEVLGVPLGTVNSRLARALRDLRLELEVRDV
jgi:RNA polymerase sigma-70 factor (ECF subfamily)